MDLVGIVVLAHALLGIMFVVILVLMHSKPS